MEISFGQDFSGVRVHTSRQAAESARALGARAYTVGSDIVFASGQYAPGIPAGDRLLAHELAHVLQQSPLGTPPAILRQADPAAAATYPTSTERGHVQEILNPQQEKAAQAGATVPPVTEPVDFRNDMTARMDPYINKVLVQAKKRQASSVVLGMPELQGISDIAQAQVTSFYGKYLTAAVHAPAEQAARAGFQLRAHLHEVPAIAGADTDKAAKDWVASRMRAQGADLLDTYHLIIGNAARDEALFKSVRDFIFAKRTADLRDIILFFPGYEVGGEAYIQRRLLPQDNEGPGETLRRGRWETLGTTIHEMLHAVSHEDFRQGVEGLEASGIAVEGFAEYFTRPVYDLLSDRVVQDDALRAAIEGQAGPFMRPPDRKGYQPYVDAVRAVARNPGR